MVSRYGPSLKIGVPLDASTLNTGAGDDVVLADRDDVDLTDAAAVEAFWDRLETTPRWVVNAAGGFRPGTVAESEPADFRFLTELNLVTAWWSCRAAARRLPAGGGIVNVAARSGQRDGRGRPGRAAADHDGVGADHEGRLSTHAAKPAVKLQPSAGHAARCAARRTRSANSAGWLKWHP